MIYIADEWIRDQKNRPKIFNLINKDTDIILNEENPEDIYNALMEMGEDIVAERYRRGELTNLI